MKKKKKLEAFKEQQFIIPQLNSSYDGLKTKKDAFNKSTAASPFFGRDVKDIIYTKELKEKPDPVKAYDIFRSKEDKRITDEELLRRYGTKYPEFKGLSKERRAELFGVLDYSDKTTHLRDRILEKFDDKPEIKFNFERIEPEEEVREVPHFFEQEFKPETLPEPEVKEYDKTESVYRRYHTNRSDSSYVLPPLDLFETSANTNVDEPKWLIEKKEIINETLSDFDINGEVSGYIVGPIFTRYEISLEPGVKVNKVSNLFDNFRMNLGVATIRILAPIPGKNRVGIEVPNDTTRPVLFGDLISEDYQYNSYPLQVIFGQDIEGNTIYRDICDMPHCLIAGATKSGKSVCINTLLSSLLLKNRPDQLRLILIDPKKVELSFYDDLPHLITPVITDSVIAAKALEWAVIEMEERYELLSRAHVRNIESYNIKAAKPDNDFLPLPYIVIVIDELADLMLTSTDSVETSINRITQKARAAGIHLIVATQRPTVNIIKGNIKANIPSRVAFRVTSFTDSNTILDEGGAENLLGKGDMLIKSEDTPIRVQGSLIEDDEINDLCDFIRDHNETDYLFTHEDLLSESEEQKANSAGFTESYLYDIACYCVGEATTSVNAVMKQFSLNIKKAQEVFTIFEERGIFSRKMGGTGGRTILVDMASLNQLFGRS